MIVKFVASIGSKILTWLAGLGRFVTFILQALRCTFTPRWYAREVLRQLFVIGYLSLPIVGMTAIFTGAVLVLQSYVGFSRFSAESSIPMVVVISMVRELGPVLCGLMVTARVGSAIASELATMKVADQIDALSTLQVSPTRYLVAPRVIATSVTMPILTFIADIIGIMGGYLTAVYKLGFNEGFYIEKTLEYLKWEDVYSGLVKAAAFGFAIAICGCYQGSRAQNGAIGVGRATTSAVVTSAALILALNYFITDICFA